MTTFRWITCLLSALTIMAGPTQASAQTTPSLLPFPDTVRPNDVFYLAGGGFVPRQPLVVYLFCQDPWHSYFGHWSWTLSTTAGWDGHFSGWKLHSPTPFTRDPVTCTLTAADGDNPYGTSTHITIRPAGAKTTRILVPVNVQPRPVTPSGMEAVDVSSAPGAVLSFVLHYPRLRPETRTAVMPWTGRARLHWKLPSGVRRGDRVRISVNGHLGIFAVHTQDAHFVARR